MGWHEYRSLKAVPQLDLDGGISAEYWKDADGSVLVRAVVEPGEDFWTYTKYCFGSGLQLVSLELELRTAWGWSYRSQMRMEKGSLRRVSQGFFDIETSKPIPKPEGADDIPKALKPTVFTEEKELPFFHLLGPTVNRPSAKAK
jgi:hypothetical protein